MSNDVRLLKKAHSLRMPTEAWARFQGCPGWYSESYIGIDFFSEDDRSWVISESIFSEAAYDGRPDNKYFLSLLMNQGTSNALEADFGAGEFLRPSRPGCLVFGDERSIRKLQGVGPFHSVIISIDCDEFHRRMATTTGDALIPLEYLLTRTFCEVKTERLILALMQSYRRQSIDDNAMSREEIKDQLVMQLMTNLNVKTAAVNENDKIKKERITRVIEYIHANCVRKITRDELASVAGVEAHHFTRLFRQTIGETPKRYLMNVRMNRAIEMMHRLEPTVAIADIAASCGFDYPSHFCAEFRRHTGTTPESFRREIYNY